MEQQHYPMKTDFAHLSAERRGWILYVTDIIRAYADVEMIILYGSYARGDHVEDPIGRSNNEGGPGDGTFPYYSDLDILVLTEKLKTARKIERHDFRQLQRDDNIMPLSLIAHTVKHFNRLLELGEYFYVDIAKEGILLHDSGAHHLKWPKNLGDEERKERAERKLHKWSKSGNEFLEYAEIAIKREHLNKAAFFLHQAAESYLTAAGLYLTGYRPHTHRLDELIKQAARGNAAFINALPRTTKEDRRLFNLLQSAYVDARYESTFDISENDLAELKTRVESLRTRVQSLHSS